MANACCNNTSVNNGTTNKTGTYGGGFAFVLVLFILVILVGAAWAY
jgi:uncharacterized protein (TIGR01732 family)